MLDRNKFRFPTRVQKINELMVRKVHRMKFMKELTEFWDRAGSPLVRIPVIGGAELNLHLLHTTVAKLGGYERVCAERRWMEVTENMSIHNASAQHVSGALKKQYQALLLPWDEQKKKAPEAPAAAPAGDEAAAAAAVAAAGAPSEGAEAAGAAAAGPTMGAAAEAAVEQAAEPQSSGGSLMSRRSAMGGASGAELVLLASGDTSNAGEPEEVIAYEPPKPGMELCEICCSGEGNESMLLCDRCNCGFHMSAPRRASALPPPLASSLPRAAMARRPAAHALLCSCGAVRQAAWTRRSPRCRRASGSATRASRRSSASARAACSSSTSTSGRPAPSPSLRPADLLLAAKRNLRPVSPPHPGPGAGRSPPGQRVQACLLRVGGAEPQAEQEAQGGGRRRDDRRGACQQQRALE